MIRAIFSLLTLAVASADMMFDMEAVRQPADFKTNLTTGGPYTYSQSAHHFWGMAYDGSNIDTTSACAGNTGDIKFLCVLMLDISFNVSLLANNLTTPNDVLLFYYNRFLQKQPIVPVHRKLRAAAPRHLHAGQHVHLQELPQQLPAVSVLVQQHVRPFRLSDPRRQLRLW